MYPKLRNSINPDPMSNILVKSELKSGLYGSLEKREVLGHEGSTGAFLMKEAIRRRGSEGSS